ncbi:zinc knuckle CX2CX4HX4C containing protein [Tanacetum coccineum]
MLMIKSVGLHSSVHCLQSAATGYRLGFVCARSSYARAMIELWADVKLKDTIMVVMPKLIGEGFYRCTICVEYEWKPSRCLSCRVFGHVLDECPKNIVSDVEKN